jgi:1,4-dihydroxy-2-naphthoate octaprenyltransferase
MLLILRCLRVIAFIAFMAVGAWLAFWHHHDGLQWRFIAPLISCWAILIGLNYFIKRKS